MRHRVCTFAEGTPRLAEHSAWIRTRSMCLPPRKVVLIDDNADLIFCAKIYLMAHGHDVWMAHTGLVAIPLVKEVSPDIVFCDIGLPGIDGYQVAKAIRCDPALVHTRLIALTACTAEQDQGRVIAAGFERHLVKPTSLVEILELVEDNATNRLERLRRSFSVLAISAPEFGGRSERNARH